MLRNSILVLNELMTLWLSVTSATLCPRGACVLCVLLCVCVCVLLCVCYSCDSHIKQPLFTYIANLLESVKETDMFSVK